MLSKILVDHFSPSPLLRPTIPHRYSNFMLPSFTRHTAVVDIHLNLLSKLHTTVPAENENIKTGNQL